MRGRLTADESLKSLNYFQNNESPGMDGLTVEFYKANRDIISVFNVDTLNCSYDKDKYRISNWRPISCINEGFKIASKAVAWRMQVVLQKLIHYNKRAFVKGR